ncbi:hypothetical protein AVEN_72373-1 [Araneus ventricosus]|uniref:Uncharacterized protein n=1 Tax=Araneus ventricosus TaxID=182803 RepID=A0A4Y2TMP6_ARAVE|nr:hypothetical protein AVEN_72373-1 [Araneus ventricosus]
MVVINSQPSTYLHRSHLNNYEPAFQMERLDIQISGNPNVRSDLSISHCFFALPTGFGLERNARECSAFDPLLSNSVRVFKLTTGFNVVGMPSSVQ